MPNCQRRAPGAVAAVILLTALLTATPASAAPCVGFTDVDDSHPFCKHVEWLKNRSITLGCLTATTYCPNEDVIRLSMAAFLNRLGNALTPIHLGLNQFDVNLDIDTSPLICITPDATIESPRMAHGGARVVAGQSLDVDFAIEFMESTNSGKTWNAVSPRHAMTAKQVGTRRTTLSVLLPPRDLVIGTTYRYALRLSRVPGSPTTGDASTWLCSVQIRLENRNPLTSPLDPVE